MTSDAAASPHDPDPAVIAELDRLSDASRADPGDIDAQVALWRAVASLEHWFCIMRGTAEAPRPYALAAEAGPTLCIFSTAARATRSARNGLIADGDPVPLAAVPLPQAIDWAMSLAAGGIVGVVIDHPMLGAWTPLANLERLRPGGVDAQR